MASEGYNNTFPKRRPLRERDSLKKDTDYSHDTFGNAADTSKQTPFKLSERIKTSNTTKPPKPERVQERGKYALPETDKSVLRKKDSNTNNASVNIDKAKEDSQSTKSLPLSGGTKTVSNPSNKTPLADKTNRPTKAQVRKFEKIKEDYDREEDKRSHEKFDAHYLSKVIRQQLDREERKLFADWFRNEVWGPIDEAQNTETPLNTLLDLVKKTKFNNITELHGLMWEFNKRAQPIFPLGRDRYKNTYLLAQSTEMLTSHEEDADYLSYRDQIRHDQKRHYKGIHPDDQHETMPQALLGINYHVEPVAQGRERRAKDLPLISDKVGKPSNSANGSGFMFYQLGDLTIYLGHKRLQEVHKELRAGKPYPSASDWVPTGFAVVVRINSEYQAGAVYIIYNFFPKELDGVPLHSTNDISWGRIPNGVSQEQFSVAKIADSIDELGMEKEFHFDIKCFHEPELVPVNKNKDGQIFRSFVASK
ncbi:MAG: hypothetical protein M1831_007220 [Alyxoria varia]|nr:MAG: hypothetical protein M1831_007220 [Alyxoria varia]